eukprot:6491457-Amphidinium_carterae.1
MRELTTPHFYDHSTKTFSCKHFSFHSGTMSCSGCSVTESTYNDASSLAYTVYDLTELGLKRDAEA